MRSYLQTKRYRFMLGVTLLLTALGALAATAAPPEPGREVMALVQATTSAPTAAAPMVDPAEGHLSTEAGVRRAAAQGIDSLRRYVNRTRIIYNYRVVDFVTPEMSNHRQ